MEGGREPAGQAGDEARQTREDEESQVDAGAEGVLGDVVREKAQKDAHRERRKGDAERTADDRKQHALGEELAANAAARRTQGEASRNLSAPCGAAGEEETGDIQAGEAEQKDRRGEEHPERLRQAAPQR